MTGTDGPGLGGTGDARRFLARPAPARGVGGTLIVRMGSGDGEILPGSMAFPPCQCGSERCPDSGAGDPGGDGRGPAAVEPPASPAVFPAAAPAAGGSPATGSPAAGSSAEAAAGAALRARVAELNRRSRSDIP